MFKCCFVSPWGRVCTHRVAYFSICFYEDSELPVSAYNGQTIYIYLAKHQLKFQRSYSTKQWQTKLWLVINTDGKLYRDFPEFMTSLALSDMQSHIQGHWYQSAIRTNRCDICLSYFMYLAVKNDGSKPVILFMV
jgi:hypothetical protein